MGAVIYTTVRQEHAWIRHNFAIGWQNIPRQHDEILISCLHTSYKSHDHANTPCESECGYELRVCNNWKL